MLKRKPLSPEWNAYSHGCAAKRPLQGRAVLGDGEPGTKRAQIIIMVFAKENFLAETIDQLY